MFSPNQNSIKKIIYVFKNISSELQQPSELNFRRWAWQPLQNKKVQCYHKQQLMFHKQNTWKFQQWKITSFNQVDDINLSHTNETLYKLTKNIGIMRTKIKPIRWNPTSFFYFKLNKNKPKLNLISERQRNGKYPLQILSSTAHQLLK